MTELRVISLLGEIARPHYAAVSQLAGHAAGCEPGELEEPGLALLDEVLSAPGPTLLFMCGLPYVRARDRGVPVEPVAGAVPLGEPGPVYFADLVVRAGLEAGSPGDLAGMRIGLNGRDSLSGYVLPYAMLAPRGLAASLYDGAIETGSHGRSLELLLGGELDAAAIDSTILALERRRNPAIAGLPVLERLGPAPIPPVVLLHGDPALARRLRQALTELGASAAGRRALELGLVERYAPMGDADYDAVREMDAAVR